MKPYINSLLVAALLCVSGCAGFNAKSAEQLVVEVATIKVVKNNPTKANVIIGVAEAVKKTASGEGFDTVAALMTFVNAEVAKHPMAPEDALIVNLLLQTIENGLIQELGSGKIPAAKLIVISEFASWVEDGAKMGVAALPAQL